jgi:hypothetical protein
MFTLLSIRASHLFSAEQFIFRRLTAGLKAMGLTLYPCGTIPTLQNSYPALIVKKWPVNNRPRPSKRL